MTNSNTSVIIDEMINIGILETSNYDKTLIKLTSKFIYSIDMSKNNYDSTTRSMLITLMKVFKVIDRQALVDYMSIIDQLLENLSKEMFDERGNLLI